MQPGHVCFSSTLTKSRKPQKGSNVGKTDCGEGEKISDLAEIR